MSSEELPTNPNQLWPQEQDRIGEPAATVLSPVDQILTMPQQGRSLLDTRPAGAPVPRWMWVLPLTLALPGGIAGWFLLRDSNRGAAWAMLVVGIVVTVFTLLTWGPMKALMMPLGI